MYTIANIPEHIIDKSEVVTGIWKLVYRGLRCMETLWSQMALHSIILKFSQIATGILLVYGIYLMFILIKLPKLSTEKNQFFINICYTDIHIA